MSRLSTEDAREAACHLAFCKIALDAWLDGCTLDKKYQRCQWTMMMLFSDRCASCGLLAQEHHAIANGQLCPREAGGNGRTFRPMIFQEVQP